MAAARCHRLAPARLPAAALALPQLVVLRSGCRDSAVAGQAAPAAGLVPGLLAALALPQLVVLRSGCRDSAVAGQAAPAAGLVPGLLAAPALPHSALA